jgi:hypothetical protein
VGSPLKMTDTKSVEGSGVASVTEMGINSRNGSSPARRPLFDIVNMTGPATDRIMSGLQRVTAVVPSIAEHLFGRRDIRGDSFGLNSLKSK